jgi:ADP-ribose pyrophosphatase YjhB (NUDIX family)
MRHPDRPLRRFLHCPRCGQPTVLSPFEGKMRDHCAFCDRIWYENAKPCAGILLEDELGRIVLTRRNIPPFEGLWDLPGGFLEADESPEAGALRELRGELGVEATLVGLLGVYVDRHLEGEDPTAWHHSLNFFFRARDLGQPLQPDPKELREARWFDRDALPPWEEVAYDNGRRALQVWLEAPLLRVHEQE